MTDPTDLLAGATHVVLQDFPDPDVPEALVRAGLQVTVYGGPDPSDVSQLERRDDVVVAIDAGRRPDSADLLSVYRPPTEISGVVAEAVRLGVSAVWRQPAADEPADVSARWRSAVEAAGLEYLDSPPIAGVASGLAASRPPS
jgi:hypothetical protein